MGLAKPGISVVYSVALQLVIAAGCLELLCGFTQPGERGLAWQRDGWGQGQENGLRFKLYILS
jgi:hypothetical protein